MQKYLVYLEPNKIDLLNDSVGMSDTFDPQDTGYLLDSKLKEKDYDFVIASASNENAYLLKKNSKLILIVSHVPEQDSKEWPSFYVNLCMADAVGCDSFINAKLNSFTYPEKRIINLDGCSTLVSKSKSPLDMPKNKIPIFNLDKNTKIWEKFSTFILSKYQKEFEITPYMSKYAVGIAFYPISNTIATFAANRLKHIMVPYDKNVSVYLDARSNHYVGAQIGNLISISSGQGVNQKITEVFETFVDELVTLVKHTEKHEPFVFTSNANIYDRIFFEINRTFTN